MMVDQASILNPEEVVAVATLELEVLVEADLALPEFSFSVLVELCFLFSWIALEVPFFDLWLWAVLVPLVEARFEVLLPLFLCLPVEEVVLVAALVVPLVEAFTALVVELDLWLCPPALAWRSSPTEGTERTSISAGAGVARTTAKRATSAKRKKTLRNILTVVW